MEVILTKPQIVTLAPELAKEVAQNTQHTVTNNTGHNILFIVTMRAGSGDINHAHDSGTWGQSGDSGWRHHYSLAGNRGTYINLTHNNNTYTAIGGKGNREDVLNRTQRFYWHRNRDGSGNITSQYWQHHSWQYSNGYKIAREGQTKIFPLLLRNNETIEVAFTSYGAKNYDTIRIFQGGVTLAPF